MYVPPHFKFADQAEQVAFMRDYLFALVVSVGPDGAPVASHLPFVVEEDATGGVVLLAHFAKNNPQWQYLENQTTLVVFSEPHAYVSPGWYAKEQNVPTWNYVAVHAYGKATLIQDEADVLALLEKQIHTYEQAYAAQWERLSEGYKKAMIQGIVAFSIAVERLEGKRKLSQNKPLADQQNVMAHLLENTDASARTIGRMMEEGISDL